MLTTKAGKLQICNHYWTKIQHNPSELARELSVDCTTIIKCLCEMLFNK